MKAGTSKPGSKYISKKKIKGQWVYKYDEPKKKLVVKKPIKKKFVVKKELIVKKPVTKKLVIEKKPVVKKTTPKLTSKKKFVITKKKVKIEDFYQEGKHRYFKTQKQKKEFLKEQKLGMAGGRGQKILTAERIKIGTSVTFKFGGESYNGKVIATDGTVQRSPTQFDIEFISNSKTYIKKGVPRENIKRKAKSRHQVVKKEKTDQMESEVRAMNTRAISEGVKEQAQQLVRTNWDIFEKVAGKYYNTRIKGGWDARKFGFEEEDLKMEAAVVVMKAAQSFLINKPKDKRATFKTYVLSFLKADLAAALAVGSGAGGHLKASVKNQMYLWFFKDTLDDYKSKHDNAIPSDAEILESLEAKRKSLSNVKGNRTFIAYPWTLEKVRNAKSQSKKMESLQKIIADPTGSTATTMQSILNDEEIETFGHYRADPWVEAQKAVVKSGVEESLNRVFKNTADREILKRRFGLFIDEDSPASLRRYAQGWAPGEVANFLTQKEKRKGSQKKWTAGDVNRREIKLLKKLGEDEKFTREMKDFVKSGNQDKEWSDAGLLIYWISIYKVIEQSMIQFMSLVDSYELDSKAETEKVTDVNEMVQPMKLGFKKK